MSPQRFRRVDELFQAVQEVEPTRRATFLLEACDGDSDLQREVESLLAQNSVNDGLLDRPPVPPWPQFVPGVDLGPYRIVSRIGAGGMGEVWRARDTRLNRDVAIKTSLSGFNGRFRKEAQAIAALNHPNVCHLYDVGPDYLVMELVEGTTLKGPLPLDEALKIAEQIAQALQAAHEKGIVHRDLKPANIKITLAGVVKVLDFGLARMAAPDSAGPDDSPTLPSKPSEAGTILGTPAYMAPEQARGKPVDKRADIWAFGVVLYEILTAKQLFPGETVTDIVAGVLTKEPDLTTVPGKVRHLLARCLAKDPKQRLRDIGDWKDLLTTPNSAAPQISSRPILWMATAIVAVLAAAAAIGFTYFRQPASRDAPLHLSVPLPADSSVQFVELSPDGRKLLVVVKPQPVQPAFYIKTLETGELRKIDTPPGRTPFWSPDSTAIGSFDPNSNWLQIAPATGGPPRVLCRDLGVEAAAGGTWSRQGTILFSVRTGLMRTDINGGACNLVGKADPAVRFPVFLPDGKHFFYSRIEAGEAGGLYIATLGEPIGRRLLADRGSISYVAPIAGSGPGYILFKRGSTLQAQAFDPSTLRIVGPPFEASPHVSETTVPGQVAVSASTQGTVAWLEGVSDDSRFTWRDRAGNILEEFGQPGEHFGVNISPDGKRLLAARARAEGEEIVLYDLARTAVETRVVPPATTNTAIWAAQPGKIWFSRNDPGVRGIYQQDVGGGLPVQILKQPDSENLITISDQSRDGKFLVYTSLDPKTASDIWYAPVEAGGLGTPVKLVATPLIEGMGQVSLDGKWLAYVSIEADRASVYVRPFPDGTIAQPIAPGLEPRWAANGRELYFIRRAKTPRVFALNAVSVEPDGVGGLRFGTPHMLFEFLSAIWTPAQSAWMYSPHPDGKRFLVITLTDTGPPVMNIVTNWRESIGQKSGPR